jgi:hypothetical protein
VDMNGWRFTVELGMAKKNIAAVGRSMPRDQKNQLRADLLELAKACPFHRSKPEDCPLAALRKMKSTERLQWFNALAEDDLLYLATYHRVCFAIKAKSRSA